MRRDLTDALDSTARSPRPAEGQRREDGELVRASCRRCRRGSAYASGASAHPASPRRFALLLAHRRQDVVAGACEDAGDALMRFAASPRARLDGRDAAATEASKASAKPAPPPPRPGPRMHGEQRLVRPSPHVARGDGRFHSALAAPRSADASTTSSTGIGGEGHGVVSAQAGQRDCAIAVALAAEGVTAIGRPGAAAMISALLRSSLTTPARRARPATATDNGLASPGWGRFAPPLPGSPRRSDFVHAFTASCSAPPARHCRPRGMP